MKNYIENPISNKNWDPSKGDYVSEKIIQEEKLYHKKTKRKKTFTILLAAIHLLLLFIIFLSY
jgi:predicted nucleic acid-binding Zn ribbon protein